MWKIRKILVASSEEGRLREQICCSAPWADAILAAVCAGNQQTLRKLYPPGGKSETGMKKCPTCNKWCPPNSSGGSLCCDCECHATAARFLAWAKSPMRRELVRDLVALSWPSAICYRDFVANPMSGLLATELKDQEPPRPVAGTESFGWMPDLVPSEWREGGEAPARKTDIDRGRVAVEIALRRLKPRAGRRVAPGCCLPVLAEGEECLKNEIKHFEDHKPVTPPKFEDFSGGDIDSAWIARGVIPSTAVLNYKIRKGPFQRS
jgi:hypothetical protein